jgi:hypothetical protein
MTTVLHRSTKKEHLEKDYVIKSKPAKGIDDTTPEAKNKAIEITRQVAQIIYNNRPVNIGQGRAGCICQGRTIADILEGLKNLGGLSASVFDNREAVLKTLKEIRDGEFGQSITVAGSIEDIFEICKEIGTEPHTAIVPLGIWGKTELLPREGIKELTMMCGHGLVSAYFCEHLVAQVENGELSCDEAVKELSRVCICGAFNVTLARDIFNKTLITKASGSR